MQVCFLEKKYKGLVSKRLVTTQPLTNIPFWCNVIVSISMAGCRINKIYFGVQYEIGMYNMLKDSETSLKNTNFSVNVGYNF